MSNSDFYNHIKFIAAHQGTVALIDINEFRRLRRINGEYKWQKFQIGDLRAIPIKTDDFTEKCRTSKNLTTIRLIPNWSFLTNGKKVVTSSIETFNISEDLRAETKYTLSRHTAPNHHYFSNFSWEDLADKPMIQRENAVEWAKHRSSCLLKPVEEEVLVRFLGKYAQELEEFNVLYEESADTAQELSNYQKKLK